MISLIIPTRSKQREYTEFLLKNIEELYPGYQNKGYLEVIVSEDDLVSLGNNYNNAIKKARGEKIILLHNDMVLGRGFLDIMDRDIMKGRITTYTRVEPPIFPDQAPGKVVVDFGRTLEDFNKKKWEAFFLPDIKQEGGSQLFLGCMKEDWIGLDGKTFQMFCEDDDLHLRYQILGFEKVISPAFVYHFVSKTSRIGKDYHDIELESREKFNKKWRDILYID